MSADDWPDLLRQLLESLESDGGTKIELELSDGEWRGGITIAEDGEARVIPIPEQMRP